MRIPILSLWQPWASLLVHGRKRNETRSWAYKGKLPVVMAIHAAKKWNGDLSALCVREPFKGELECISIFHDNPFTQPRFMPFGAVVGLVRLVECRYTGNVGRPHPEWMAGLSQEERAFGDYSPERHGWICDRFHAFQEPIPLKGQQGI